MRKLLVYIGVIFLLTGFLSISFLTAPSDRESGGLPMYPTEFGSIQSFSLEAPSSEALEFQHVEGRWYVGNSSMEAVPAREARVQGLIQELLDLTSLRRVSSRADRGDFGLIEGEQTRIFFLNSQREPLLFRFGVPTSLGNELYFRRNDEPDIYAIPGNLGFYFGQTLEYWQDLRAWPEAFGFDEVLSVTLTMTGQGPQTLVLDTDERGEGIWRRSGSTTGTDSEGGSKLRNLLAIEFVRLVAQPPDTEILGTIQIRGVGNQNLRGELYPGQGGNFVLKATGEGVERLGLIPDWRFDELF